DIAADRATAAVGLRDTAWRQGTRSARRTAVHAPTEGLALSGFGFRLFVRHHFATRAIMDVVLCVIDETRLVELLVLRIDGQAIPIRLGDRLCRIGPDGGVVLLRRQRHMREELDSTRLQFL